MNRSKLQDTAEKNFEFVEKRGLMATLPKGLVRRIKAVMLPLRHLEWAANTNNCSITAYGYGAAITQATMFNTMDRLGIAQYISRIGLVIDGNTGESLRAAKQAWLTDPVWQPLRKMAEDTFVVTDWFELFVAQNVVLDGLVYPLVYGHFDTALAPNGGSAFAMLTEFMSEWFAEHTRWVDQTLRIAAGESDANRAIIGAWLAKWQPVVLGVLQPLARRALGENAHAALAAVAQDLSARTAACGLEA